MKKQICVVFFSVVMILTLPALAADNGFHRVSTYASGQFADVPEDIWCAENVRSACEFGIMGGKGAGLFDVNGNLTLAETITMACRLHSTYTGIAVPEASAGGGAWYQRYLDYAVGNGIFASFSDYSAPASRKDFAVIMDSALTDMELPVISSIEAGSIPDVAADADYCAAVYRLYEAGILTGSDARGSFLPDSTMTRGEAAALASRIVDPALRKPITLTMPEFVFEPVAVTQLQNYGSLKKKCTDEEFQAAYDAALEVVEPLAELSLEDQLMGVAVELRQIFESGMSYSMTDDHYNDPYGYFVLGSASCAGCTRATGLCLNILGISYEHVNEGLWSHQWCRVDVNGVYWICDAYGLYCGPEPAPYEHPYF